MSMYTINPTTGALASIGPPVPSNDEFTDSVTVDPSGKFAYVTSSGDVWDIDFGSVATYTINPTTGALTSTTGGINGTGVNGTPEFFNSVAVDPSGKFAYAADGGAFPAWQLRRFIQRLDVHHQQHYRGLDVHWDDRRRNRSRLRGRRSCGQVRLCNEFRTRTTSPCTPSTPRLGP